MSAQVIWINGPFGVGKTTVASEIRALLPGSIVFDPELVGTLLQYTLPELPDDYQDLALWRRTVRFLIGQIARSGTVPVIVPMTLTNETYFEEIGGGIRADGLEGQHVTLVADAETIRVRMSDRKANQWAVHQIERCIAAFDGRERFREYLDTWGQSPRDVAQRVVALIGAAGNDAIRPELETER